LRETLDAAGVSQQELATYLQASDEDTANIINGKAAADVDQQQLIAACLRRNIRELFTDLPPKPAVVAPATPAAVPQPS
jgi:transcriptional regulator with XRE-family HTH domain